MLWQKSDRFLRKNSQVNRDKIIGISIGLVVLLTLGLLGTQVQATANREKMAIICGLGKVC